MSVVAAAVGPGAAAVYGGQLCGGGARKRKDVVVQDQEEERGESSHGLFVLETVREDGDEEAERSSIWAGSDDDEEGDQEVESGGTAMRRQTSALACMDALDDALPIKRGLSNFFSGKSRSFANLQDAEAAISSARDLAKPENPFNKRRRVLRCTSIRRVSSTSLTALPPFLPPPPDAGGNASGGRWLNINKEGRMDGCKDPL